MTDDSNAAAKRAWMKAVLGVAIPARGDGVSSTPAPTMAAADPSTPIAVAARNPQVWTQAPGAALAGGAPPATLAPAAPIGPKTTVVSRTGRKIEVVAGNDGRVALTTDSPPMEEITFSGGGGKGAALPGAVKALEETGMLKDVKSFHGASVGSMTAAVLAAGMSAEAFTKLANDTKMMPIVKGHDFLPINVDGDGLEKFVREEIGSSVHGKIAAFLNGGEGGNGIDKTTRETVMAIDGKIGRGGGVTFGDLRTLSKIVPGIKDLVISGTMTGDDSAHPGKIDKGKPQLAIFSADTEPDLDVARAVHASAALPPVFKPVDIKLSSGITARFEDGGVLNNAPTSDLIGAERPLDPMPKGGKMTFVFESDAAEGILKGEATPSRSRINDFVSGAPNSAADYALDRALADRPEDVVMVPLKFKGPWYKRTDFSGFIGGTVNFDMARDDKLKLQGMTETATLAHIKKSARPETHEFASADAMLNSVARADLEGLADSNFPGAKNELKFRDDVAKGIAALEAVAPGAKADALAKGPLQQALKALDDLGRDNNDRLAYIGRELNRDGKLDPLLDLAKAQGFKGSAVLEAGVVVADVLATRAHVQTILREVVYPKMVKEDPKGVSGILLREVDNRLRSARTAKDVNAALSVAIKYFAGKRDLGGLLGHHAFATTLKSQLMKE